MNNFEFDLRQLLKNAGLERKSVDQLAQPTSCGPVPQYRTHECKKACEDRHQRQSNETITELR